MTERQWVKSFPLRRRVYSTATRLFSALYKCRSLGGIKRCRNKFYKTRKTRKKENQRFIIIRNARHPNSASRKMINGKKHTICSFLSFYLSASGQNENGSTSFISRPPVSYANTLKTGRLSRAAMSLRVPLTNKRVSRDDRS